MDINSALASFSALSQDTRLRALRLLVRHGKQGISAGELSKKLKVPQNTLSFHLLHLSNAGLITSHKQGRSIIYAADIQCVQALVKFLLEDCCAVDQSTCRDVEKLLRKTCC